MLRVCTYLVFSGWSNRPTSTESDPASGTTRQRRQLPGAGRRTRK